MKYLIPSYDSLVAGYGKVIEHALSLAAASVEINESRTGTRLAMAELAQEEVGKSFSILTAFALPPDEDEWKQFWHDFRNHTLKVSRALFYEWFEPTRISIVLEDGSMPNGISRFPRTTEERTIGLYIDYDVTTGTFVGPGDRVKPSDAANRIISVVNLAQKALALHTILMDHDVEFSLREWSKIATRLCSKLTYQQNMSAVLDEFAAQSERHRRLRERVDEGMRMTGEALKKLVASQKRRTDA